MSLEKKTENADALAAMQRMAKRGPQTAYLYAGLTGLPVRAVYALAREHAIPLKEPHRPNRGKRAVVQDGEREWVATVPNSHETWVPKYFLRAEQDEHYEK